MKHNHNMIYIEKHKEFFCGWGAGCVETMILFPQSKLIFRQQLHGVVFRVAFDQLRSEGITRLYRGLLPPLLMRTTTRALMFGMFDKLQKTFGCYHSPPSTPLTLCHAFAAFFAGSIEAVLCPLERVQVLLQTNRYHDRYRNTAHALAQVAKLGPRELYRGLSLVLVRNGFSNSLFFTLRDPLRVYVFDLHKTSKSEKIRRIPEPLMHFIADFVSGALLGATLSTMFFPINVIKQRMQSTVQTPFLSGWNVFRIIWNERNGSARVLFRGVQLNFTRSLLAWGITNSVYELLRRSFESRTTRR
uniref:Solute carrier family 25 member 51 n=1 Tax=Parascaris univalens TaxID=6257 RepID=A0A915A7S4_PARUN